MLLKIIKNESVANKPDYLTLDELHEGRLIHFIIEPKKSSEMKSIRVFVSSHMSLSHLKKHIAHESASMPDFIRLCDHSKKDIKVENYIKTIESEGLVDTKVMTVSKNEKSNALDFRYFDFEKNDLTTKAKSIFTEIFDEFAIDNKIDIKDFARFFSKVQQKKFDMTTNHMKLNFMIWSGNNPHHISRDAFLQFLQSCFYKQNDKSNLVKQVLHEFGYDSDLIAKKRENRILSKEYFERANYSLSNDKELISLLHIYLNEINYSNPISEKIEMEDEEERDDNKIK